MADAPLIDVFSRDAATGERLFGAVLSLVAESGEEIVSFEGDKTLSGVAGPGSGELAPLPPGSYIVVERSAPWAAGWDPSGGAQYRIAEPVRIELSGAGDRVEVVLEHEKAASASESSETGTEGVGIEPGKGSKRPPLFSKARLFFSPASSEPGSAESRMAVCRRGMLAAVAIAVVVAWAASPALWMTAFGIAALGRPGFGPLFALKNFFDYLSGYALNGWGAVSIMRANYAVPWMVDAACAIGTVVVLILLLKALQERLEEEVARNPLLDSLPPAAGHNECGSARFIRDPKEIAGALKTCNADIGSLEKAGPVLGYLPEPLWRTSLKTAHSDMAAIWLRARGGGKGGSESARGPMVIAEKVVYDDEDENTVIVADTRAGKTRRLLLGTIDFLTRATEESLIILDPKGELYALTSPTVRSRGVPVNRIDFRFPRFSHRWNPMQLVNEAARRAHEAEGRGDRVALREAYDEMNSAAEDLVLMILPKDQDTGPNTFFNQGARSYIKSTVLFVAVWRNCPDNQRSLATVSRIIDRYGASRPVDEDNPASERLTPYIWMLDYLPRDHPAYEAFSNARSAVDKERSQFVTTALGALQDFRDSNIASLTSDTDVPLKQTGLERSVTYLIIPLEKDSYKGFATLFIKQAYQALITESTLHGGRLPFRTTFLCEEFGQIPPIDDLDQKMSASLAAGIRWILVLQSMAQVTTKYGRGYDKTILAACNNKIVLKSTDVENTGKWFSELCGKYTIAIEGGTLSGKRFALIKDSTSKSVRLGPRDRITPDEVGRWRAQFGSLMHRGASDGVFVVPLPDVSQTPTQRAFGLGDKEHNRAKSERTLYGGEPPEREEIDPWSPELKKMNEKTARGERYSDEEKREAERAFMAQLLARRIAARGKGAAGRGKAAQKGPRYGSLLDPASLRATQIVQVSSEEYLSALQGHPTWIRVEQDQEHAVKNALKQKREAILKNREIHQKRDSDREAPPRVLGGPGATKVSAAPSCLRL